MSRLLPALTALLPLLAAACSPAPQAAQAAALPAGRSSPGDHASLAHGDHTPRYGGTVYMHGDLHFEVVFDAGGRHRVFFSDAARAELPASVASEVTLTISGMPSQAETLRAEIDESGDSWVVAGSRLGDDPVVARVAFVVDGESYWIDAPYVRTADR